MYCVCAAVAREFVEQEVISYIIVPFFAKLPLKYFGGGGAAAGHRGGGGTTAPPVMELPNKSFPFHRQVRIERPYVTRGGRGRTRVQGVLAGPDGAVFMDPQCISAFT